MYRDNRSTEDIEFGVLQRMFGKWGKMVNFLFQKREKKKEWKCFGFARYT